MHFVTGTRQGCINLFEGLYHSVLWGGHDIESGPLVSLMFSCLVAIRFMSSWKFLAFEDFVEDYESKKDTHTVGYVFNTGGNKPVLRITPRSE